MMNRRDGAALVSKVLQRPTLSTAMLSAVVNKDGGGGYDPLPSSLVC